MAGTCSIDLTIPTVNLSPGSEGPSSPVVLLDEFMPPFPTANLVSRRSPVVVADLPSVRVTPGDKVKDVCSICMEDFVGDRTGKRVPCGHVYHVDCISSWLSHSDSCPLCRTTVSSSSSAH